MSEDMSKELRSSNNYNSANTFNLVIGIATLLIALLGATFAYFSATATSAENDVTVKSAYVSIYYDGGTEIRASNLIPATEQVALTKYQKYIEPFNPDSDEQILDYDQYNSADTARRCVDAKGKEVCYVYQFSVESDGAADEKTDITAYVKVNKNEFSNLSYVIYEVKLREENDVIVKDKYGFGIVDGYYNDELKGLFDEVDTNSDNVDFRDVTFAKFESPEDQTGDNGEYISTLKPVACLFGYNMPELGGEGYAVDDSARCRKFGITNQVKHTYQLVIWLNETGEIQEEQGKEFQGTIVIEVSGGLNTNEYEDGKITGTE